MDKPREIIRAVTRLGRGRRIGATLAAFAGVVAVVAASLLFAFGVSALWGWGPAAGLALVAAAGALYGFWRLIGRGLAARARLADAVDSAEARVPTLRRRLASAYYVAAAKEGRGTSPALAEAFVDDVERRLPPRMTAPLPRRYRLVPLGLLSGAAAAWLLVAFAAPGFLGDRLGALAEAAPAGGLIVRVTPGDTRVGVGAELTVEAELRRDFAGEAAVVVERGGVRDEVPLEARGPRELAAKVDAGAEGFRYYVVAGGEKSRRYKVEVVPPPSIGALRVTVTPPAYAGLPARALPPGEGDVRALAGASVRVEVGVEGADVVEIESPGGRVNCEREGDAFAGAFVVTEGGTYRVKAASPWGEAFTPRFGVVVDPDAPPEVTVLEPGRDLLIADTSRSPRLRFSCADDFGLGAVRVVYYNEVTGQRFTGEVGGGAGRRELEGDADLIPPGMDLFPGDVISYYVEAFDNDTVRGPKVGRSATYRFRFPTAAEMFEQVNDEMTEGVSDLAGLREQTRRLREQLEKAGASSKQDDAISRPELRELVAEQERLRRELGEAAQKLEALLERGEDNAISPELAAKVLEANRLLNEALDEQSREALEKLSDALREVDPERVRELMEQVRLDQAEMERNLERVINILKDAQREEMLRNLAACAEELADRQQDVLERLESANAAREQRDLARDVEEFGSDVRESAATFDEVDPELAAELRKLAEEYAKGQAKRDAERAADDLAAGEMEEAAAGGAAAEKELEELAAALREMSKRYREGKRRALLSDLDRAIERVLGASHRTESMAAEAAGGKAGPAYGERQESLAAEVGNISEDARAAAEKSLLVPLAVSEALADIGAELEAGARNAALGNGEAAVQANVRALASLNVVAAALLEVRSNVASAGSSMGLAEMIEQMKKLAEGQRQVNSEGKATFSMMPGMSPSQLRQALERLAAEQAMLREGMEKLSREGRGRGGEEAGDPGGLAKEMEELERELKAGNLDERVIEKQEKLLERMLSSTRALRVQGRSSRRRAEPAKEYATPTVAPLPGTLTAPRLEAGPASGPPAAGYVPADLRASLAEYYRRMAGGE